MTKTKPADFREAFFAQKDSRRRETVEWNGFTVEVVEPHAHERGKIRKASAKIGKDSSIDFDQTEMEIWSVIYMAHDPETGEKIFKPEDHDALAQMPGSLLDVLAKPAIKYLGEAPEVEAKN